MQTEQRKPREHVTTHNFWALVLYYQQNCGPEWSRAVRTVPSAIKRERRWPENVADIQALRDLAFSSGGIERSGDGG